MYLQKFSFFLNSTDKKPVLVDFVSYILYVIFYMVIYFLFSKLIFNINFWGIFLFSGLLLIVNNLIIIYWFFGIF